MGGEISTAGSMMVILPEGSTSISAGISWSKEYFSPLIVQYCHSLDVILTFCEGDGKPALSKWRWVVYESKLITYASSLTIALLDLQSVEEGSCQ